MISSMKKVENSDNRSNDKSEQLSENKKDWTESGVELNMKEDTERSSYAGNARNFKHVDEHAGLNNNVRTEIQSEFTKLKKQFREEMDKSTKEMETELKNECHNARTSYKEIIKNFTEEIDYKIDQYRKDMEKGVSINEDKLIKQQENISRDLVSLKEEIIKVMNDKETSSTRSIQLITQQCKNDITKFMDEKFEQMIENMRKDVNKVIEEKIEGTSKIVNAKVQEQQKMLEEISKKNKEDIWIIPKPVQEEITKLFEMEKQDNDVETPRWTILVEGIVKRVIDGRTVEQKKFISHSGTQTQVMEMENNKTEMAEALCILKEIRGQILTLKSERDDKMYVKNLRLNSGEGTDYQYLTQDIDMKEKPIEVPDDYSCRTSELQKVISKANKTMEDIDRELFYYKEKYLKSYRSYMSTTKNHKFH